MMAAKYIQKNRGRWLVGLVLPVLLCASGVLAQTADFEQLVHAGLTTALLEHDGLVVSGLEGGGLVIWQADDLTNYERLAAGSELSGNDVTDIAWTGRNIWVATNGGGLTRITDIANRRSFRLYTSNLGSLKVTAVTGLLVGDSERIYYGMDGGGVGQITDGLSGAVFTAEQDDLISNNVNSVQVFAGDLFVATPLGISRFANNLFSDQNAGLGALEVFDLALDSDGNLLAGTPVGLYQWDPAGETWSLVGGFNGVVHEVSSKDGLIYLRSNNVVPVYNGSSWQSFSTPSGRLGAIHAGNDFWIGGEAAVSVPGLFTVRNAYVGRLGGGNTFDVQEIPASQVVGVGGIAFSGSNPFLGSPAWNSVMSARLDGVWTHFRHQDSGVNVDAEYFSDGQILVADSGPEQEIWACLFEGTGLARITPETGVVDLISPQNSGMKGKRIIGLEVHPDGPVIMTHDDGDAERVEVLIDPADWGNPDSWIVLPMDRMGGAAVGVWEALVQRRDVVWFAVKSVGLVRWDINGEFAGPDEPLTWADQSDDTWGAPLVSLSGTNLKLDGTVGLEIGEDGSIWACGTGLVQFSYDEITRNSTLMTSLSEKQSALLPGLINGSVRDVARDHNGDIWVTTANGVNRVRGTGKDVEVDAYFDLGNYFSNPAYAALYSPNVITALPGLSYNKIAVSEDRQQILVAANQGASLVTVGLRPTAPEPTDDSAYLYPNPYMGDALGLKLGGLPEDVEVKVELYNLDGERFYSVRGVTVDTAFWFGANSVGKEVASGLYVVRVTAGELTRVMTLSVVR